MFTGEWKVENDTTGSTMGHFESENAFLMSNDTIIAC
jgi:hypothetical protein